MAEVRKHLAQYYQEQAPGCELRIELQPGSYVPVFRFAPAPLEQTPAMLAGQDTTRVVSSRLAGARPLLA